MEITAADSKRFNCGFFSKYTCHTVTYASPQKSKDKFVDSLLRLVRKEHFDLLIPITDFSLIPILERKEEFEDYVPVAAPSYDVAMKTFDKAKTLQIAKNLNIPFPQTVLVRNFADVQEISKTLRYPVVIKPRMKVFWRRNTAELMKVTPANYANNRDDVLEKYRKLAGKYKFGVPDNFFLIQEQVLGTGFGVELLMSDSKNKAVFMHERLREYPTTGGASTLRVSSHNDTMLCYAVKLLRAMNWEGAAMVEFKYDAETQTVNLMEVNGRLWGSLSLAIAAGVDFPNLLYKFYTQQEFKLPSYRVGVKRRWLVPGDLLWLYSSLCQKKKAYQAVKKFFAAATVPDDILSFVDPNPAVGSFLTSISAFWDVVDGTSTVFGEITGNR